MLYRTRVQDVFKILKFIYKEYYGKSKFKCLSEVETNKNMIFLYSERPVTVYKRYLYL